MSEIAPAPLPEETSVRSLVAPTETPAETTPNPEQERWAKSGAHALLLLGRSEIGEGLTKKDIARLRAIATKNHIPDTKEADAAATYLSSKYWEGKGSKEASDEWSESLDKYLGQQEGTASQKFFERMGFTLKEGGATTIKNRFLMAEDGTSFRTDSIGVFAQAIVDKNDPKQIQDNMDSIRELAKLFGGVDQQGKPIKEQIDAVVEHIHGLSNLRLETDKFIESAQAEMAMGEDMPGVPTLEWIKMNAEQYHEKREAKIQELGTERTIQDIIKKAKGATVDTETYNEVQAKIDRATDLNDVYLDPDRNEPQALKSGEIRMANIELKDENDKPMDQVTVFAKILEQLNKDDKIDISDKIKGWAKHEARHFVAAENDFTGVTIRILLSKNRDGTYTVHPDTYYDNFKNPNLSDEEKRNLKGKVAAAPGLGKTSEDLYGMSKHDLADVGLYIFEDTPDGIVGHSTSEVDKAREFMNNEENQQRINAFIDSRSTRPPSQEERADAERDICAQIAFRLQREPNWQINLEEFSLKSAKENETQA